MEHSILPGKPLHLFFLRGTGIRGVRRLSLGKTFFPCDTKGFHGKILDGNGFFEGSLRELVEMSVQEETVCAVEKIA